jgi:glycosyltransferase involved in cell wall biosynthesis
LKIKGESNLYIRDDFNTVAVSFFNKPAGKNLALIYHIDFSVFPLFLRGVFYFLNKFFESQLKKTDAIITISEYWENYFLEKGCNNVHKIYCGFDLKNFEISNCEVENFKKRFNLIGKPIVYIGNCQEAKGVVESYNSLKDLDIFIVTSGAKRVNIPAINLELDYHSYVRLLKASSVVVTMSKFKEGWCRTAHEAMLCKTPVIGSGMGGMKELLEGGKQIICDDFKNLKDKVEYLLKSPEINKRMGEDGFNYAKDFTNERFEEDWVKLANELLC